MHGATISPAPGVIPISMPQVRLLLLVTVTAAGACADLGTATPGDALVWPDAGSRCKDPGGDYDGDGIRNALEGCATSRDSDGDQVPDWQDSDSDGDRLSDAIEKGVGSSPRDTDQDGIPDYMERDSDNDGLDDGYEDENGDGVLGCCLSKCNAPDDKRQKSHCKLTLDGCGPGQKCKAGMCEAAMDFLCSAGETSPLHGDSFQDGRSDAVRGTFICRDDAAALPGGRKELQQRRDSAGEWKMALEQHGLYAKLKIAGAGPKMAAAVIDHDGADEQVAGFVISRDTAESGIQGDISAVLTALKAAGAGPLVVRASGTQGKNHEKYDQVEGTLIELNLPAGGPLLSEARDRVVAGLLGKSLGSLGGRPASWGAMTGTLVLRFATVRRFAFKKTSSGSLVTDSNGNPVDSGDKQRRRVLIMGGVTAKGYYQDPSRRSAILLDDLSNGTALASLNSSFADGCQVTRIRPPASADYIWAVDGSASMKAHLPGLVTNAGNWFDRALNSGLDFRVTVPGCVPPGRDRFLDKTEKKAFLNCLASTPAVPLSLARIRQAVQERLPRSFSDPARIYPWATLVIMAVTDSMAPELSALYSASSSDPACAWPPDHDQPMARAFEGVLAPHKELYYGRLDPEATAMFNVIGGVCGSSCGAKVARGYGRLSRTLGGQHLDICQQNLSNGLQITIDTIGSGCGPWFKLDHIPISASIAVGLNGMKLQRSRTKGFDYRLNGNSLVFINVDPGQKREVIVSYKRWIWNPPFM